MVDSLYCKYAHSLMQHSGIYICNGNVFTNFLSRSHVINPNNETKTGISNN